MSAKVIGGTYHGGTLVMVECPALVQAESGCGWEPCQAELECEQTAGGLWVLPKECPICERLITGTLLGRRIAELGADAIDNYDPTPNEQWEVTEGVSQAERYEEAGRQQRELKR